MFVCVYNACIVTPLEIPTLRLLLCFLIFYLREYAFIHLVIYFYSVCFIQYFIKRTVSSNYRTEKDGKVRTKRSPIFFVNILIIFSISHFQSFINLFFSSLSF